MMGAGLGGRPECSCPGLACTHTRCCCILALGSNSPAKGGFQSQGSSRHSPFCGPGMCLWPGLPAYCLPIPFLVVVFPWQLPPEHRLKSHRTVHAACVLYCAGEEPMAQCGRAQRRAAAVLRHQGGELLHRALRRVARRGRAVAGEAPTSRTWLVCMTCPGWTAGLKMDGDVNLCRMISCTHSGLQVSCQRLPTCCVCGAVCALAGHPVARAGPAHRAPQVHHHGRHPAQVCGQVKPRTRGCIASSRLRVRRPCVAPREAPMRGAAPCALLAVVWGEGAERGRE